MNYFLSSLIALAVSVSAYSQLTIDNTSNTVNQLVDGILIPTGSVQSVSNINFLGVYNVSNRYQIGYFSTATTTQTQMGFTDGIVLTSGNTSEIPLALGTDPGSAAQMSRNYVSCTAGEIRQGGTCPTLIQDLDVLCGNTNYFNAAILEFDFVPISTTVQFRYIFGSEEYSDDGGFVNYQCSDYNDKFGFLISGPGIAGGQGFENDARNIARLANGSEVSINAVNNGVVGSSGGGPSAANCLSANPDWVQNVSTAEYLGTIDGTQLNGNTVILTAFQSGLTPGATYHIRLMVTDVFDGAYDAVVYLEAGSFTTEPTGCTPPAAPTGTITHPDCDELNGSFDINTPIGPDFEYSINGVDFQTGITFSNLTPGDYELVVREIGESCASNPTVFTVNEPPTTPSAPVASVTTQPDCSTPTGTITVSSPANGAGVSYQLVGTNPVVSAQTNATGIFTGLAPGEYEVTVTVDGCNSSATSLTVNNSPSTPSAPIASVTQPDCSTPTGTITVSSPANGAGVTYQLVGTNPFVSEQTNATGIFTGLAPGEYEVTVMVDGCNSSATSLTVNNSPTTPSAPVASVTTQPDCSTPTGTITVSSPANGAGVTYQLVGTNPIVSEQTNATGIFTGLAPGEYEVTVMVDGCNSSATSLTVNNSPSTPSAPIASVTQPDCSTPTGTITASSPANGAGVSYQVVGTNPIVSAQTNATGIFTGLAPGEYEVTVTVDGCNSSATSLTVNNSPSTPSAPIASVTQPDCSTPTGTITASSPANGAGVSYQVVGTNPIVSAQTNATGIFTGLAPGEYEVTVTVDGCNSETIDLQVDSQPSASQVTVSASNSAVPAGTAVTLSAQGDGDLLWSTGEQGSSIEVNPTEPTEYCVLLTDQNDCQSEACLTIDVSIACGDLFVPTAFSPNGDGNNDYFHVLINPVCVEEMVLRVFNRWGEVIFETEQISEKWNGEYKGEPVNTGSFVYTLEIKLVNQELQRIAGNVTLIR